MSVHVSISLYKDVDDIDKGNDFVDEVREELQGKVTCTLQTSISNQNPLEELTKEQESE